VKENYDEKMARRTPRGEKHSKVGTTASATECDKYALLMLLA